MAQPGPQATDEEQRSVQIYRRILRSKVSIPASDNPEDKQSIRLLQFSLECLRMEESEWMLTSSGSIGTPPCPGGYGGSDCAGAPESTPGG